MGAGAFTVNGWTKKTNIRKPNTGRRIKKRRTEEPYWASSGWRGPKGVRFTQEGLSYKEDGDESSTLWKKGSTVTARVIWITKFPLSGHP